MSSYLARLVLIVLVVAVAGGCGGETNPAMSLQFADRVFVEVDPDALPEGDAGGQIAGTMANLNMLFAHVETTFDASLRAPAIVIYSNVRYVPLGTAYIPTRVVTLYKAALADSVASGIVVNPDVSGAKNYVMTKSEIKAAIPRVMQHKPLRFEVRVAGKD